MAKPTPQPKLGPWFDDRAIDDADHLLRVAKVGSAIVLNADGTFGLSDQIFTTSGGGCSTDLLSLFEGDGLTAEDRVSALAGFGAVSVGVEHVRSTDARVVERAGDAALGIAYTPIPDGERFGPNPYHCDIFPKLGNPGRKRLHAKCTVVVEINQAVAERLWNEKNGTPL